MKLHALLFLASSCLLVNSCSNPALRPVQNQANPAFRSGLNALNTPAAGIEAAVNPERMAAYLATFAGIRPIADQKTLIPERGTVQGRDLTRQFLTQTLTALGYKVERHEYRRDAANIMVTLAADIPTDEYILVGAHMDSVRNAGADDNASGSTAVLEAATVLRELKGRKVNLIFAWFDEEELGLVGSRHLARKLREQGLKISSVHAIDMMGYDGDGDHAVELARPDGVLWDYYQMVNKTHNLNLPMARTNTGRSDHVSFHDEGYDSLCISEEFTNGDSTPHYHRRSDTYETVSQSFLVAGTRLIVAAVGDLSLKVPAPINIQQIPHDRFPSREREFHASYDNLPHE